MAVNLGQRQGNNLLALFQELAVVDAKLKKQVTEARNRDKYWQNNNIRGLFISETEISDLLLKKFNDQAISNASNIPGKQEMSDSSVSHPQQSQAKETRLDFLVKTFNLSCFEKELLLLLMLPELDLRYERFFGYIQDDVTRRKPSVALAINTLSNSEAEKIFNRAVFSAESDLIRNHLIEVQEEVNRKNSPLLSMAVRINQRIRDYLLGFDLQDTNLLPFTGKVIPSTTLESIVLTDVMRDSLIKLMSDESKYRNIALYFRGSQGSGKKRVVDALCSMVSNSYLMVDIPAMISSDLPFADAYTLLMREAVLQQSPVFFHNVDMLFEREYSSNLAYFSKGFNSGLDYYCPIFISGINSWNPEIELANRTFISVEMGTPSFEARNKFWQSRLARHEIDNKSLAASLSAKFTMNIGQINRSVNIAYGHSLYTNGGHISEDNLYRACRQVSSYKLSALAQKISTRYIWDDIVLPPDQKTQLQEICNHVKYRHMVYGEWGFDKKIFLGRGLNALFIGSSGTGKTMAAEIMANELGLDLYKIDLSSVVSKYIGETEKNLNHIFKQAENSNSILFFDEADSLFGKRSEVRDSHDRYANIEIAYLLQKMEEYEGIVILATNLGKNIDEAFARRMHFTLEFPFPDEQQRLHIWQKVFPADAPVDTDVDLKFMSRQFHISGGNIKNIALAAAFLAAAENKKINMNHLVTATKREYQKIGRLCNASEFGEYL